MTASALALPASALVTGGDDDERLVARAWVEPPFDIGRYPSPLAGFRKYVDLRPGDDPTNVFTKTLFTVRGVPAGTRVRIAAMDTYDGMVWGASNDALPGEAAADSFQRVSSTIDNPAEGEDVEAEVTIGEGHSGVWLPTVGALRGIEFGLGEPDRKAESFRYNLATSTAVVPSGLRAGDTYSFKAVQPPAEVDQDTLAAAAVTALPPGTGFLTEPANDWSKEATTPMGRVLAIADHLKSEGKYSDGVTKAEQVYHPGHNLRRLSDEFINDEQMVGNDEQYAAVMALLAQEVGVPARVVLGAVVPEGGVVTGAEVEAWVELQAADGTWRTLPADRFMSKEPPAEKLPESKTPMSGTIVPPPAPIPPPSDAGEQSDADLKERKATKDEGTRTRCSAPRSRPGCSSWPSMSPGRWSSCWSSWPPSSVSRPCAGADGAPRTSRQPDSWAPGASWSTTLETWASTSRWVRPPVVSSRPPSDRSPPRAWLGTRTARSSGRRFRPPSRQRHTGD
ncbi:transglutaminase-like domain-containing protein [Nocardioides piscis]|uniref:Transglutaminase domain-containing protein n=1 Tax=Nocardioides piscis TaxID=2714938 RepID=A0A6G7YF21_9ACTN|nr:transglutaminase-like domain-containing protein [Nocardioides piscis]QIK75405.1 transglutaminase domain-containing protein [Nocardioides piscis]